MENATDTSNDVLEEQQDQDKGQVRPKNLLLRTEINQEDQPLSKEDTPENSHRHTDTHEIEQEQERSEKESYLDEDCILFHGINYLGCASVNAPRSEAEALRTIKILRNQQMSPENETGHGDKSPSKLIDVVLSVPNVANGIVRLLDPTGSGEIAHFEIYKILFCVRGLDSEPERDCFAFTEAHKKSGIFQCHVFRCELPDAVKKVLYSFELAFRSIPKNSTESLDSKKPSEVFPQSHSMSSVDDPSMDFDDSVFCFNVTLEIRENDLKGGYANVPWDKASSCFKLRKNVDKLVVMSVTQTSNVELTIERCFGLLIAPGRNVRHSDMHLLDMESMKTGSGNSESGAVIASHIISGSWDPTHSHFSLLNEETQKGTRVFISVAVDLVVQEIQEPLRFLLETKARVFPQNDKFWYYGKKVLQETFYLRLKEVQDKRLSKQLYGIVSLETKTKRLQRLAQGTTPGTPGYSMGHIDVGSPTLSSTSHRDEEDDDDTDEPLLSGSGEVVPDYSEHVLTDWGDVLQRWRADFKQRPTGLKQLVRKGVPNALRGEVWQLLAGCYDNDTMLENYRILISKDSPQEAVIQRDIHRTFPAHDFFKETGGLGQDSLYKISKAYSLYDTEVGYCQGLSFLAAALLLHMPEEQAFGVLCKIMYDYKMRELFKNGFETLHVKFYQLERAIEDLMPDLYDHFKQLQIEAHMYSSQWFLTLFTAKFPLSTVYRIIDLFLSEGEIVIFKVALSLLKCCRQDLLTHDFEGVLKYFRVSLPKKYRLDENTTQLVQTTTTIKVNFKKLKKYNKEYENMQEKLIQGDAHAIIERDNRRLMEANMRLESENDEIADELITTKITLETQLQKTMKHAESLQYDLTISVDELRKSRERVKELTDENQHLLNETKQAKELCRREMERQETEISKKSTIINDYKTITSQLSIRIEQMQNQHKRELDKAKSMRIENATNPEPLENDILQAAENEKEAFKQQIRNLELELAQTKLSKVESECKVQDLEHQLVSALKDLQSSKNTWLHKTFSTLTSSRNKDSTGQSPTLSPTSTNGPSFPNTITSKFPTTFNKKAP
ncbi:rab GTPase-activating protein 1-like [Styela clava]